MDAADASSAAPAANGRRRLMDAALRLTARKRSLHAIGVRELGREAGLNANTFYRHFRDFDALGLAIMEELGDGLRESLRALRRQPMPPQDVARRTVALVFDEAGRHPEAFLLAIRELHGASETLRTALRSLIDRLAADMASDIESQHLAPGLPGPRLARIAPLIVQQVFYLSLEGIEYPDRHAALVEDATDFIDALILGETVRAQGDARPA